MEKRCEMCGNSITCKDNRRKYCDDCREVRKHFYVRNAVNAFRERAREKRLKEQEELAGLRTENEILRERVRELETLLNRRGEHYAAD